MTKAVTDEQVATLRAQLAGNSDEYKRRWEQLDKGSAKVGYTALVAAGFFEAVDRRFAKNSVIAGRSDVVGYVGDVRARSERVANELDPHAAERLMLHALGEGSIADLDDETVAGTQMLIRAALVTDEELDDAELDAFMAEVREVAEEWTR
jgi:hypothetical protein